MRRDEMETLKEQSSPFLSEESYTNTRTCGTNWFAFGRLPESVNKYTSQKEEKLFLAFW